MRHLIHKIILYHLGKAMLSVHLRKRKNIDEKLSAKKKNVLARKRRRRGRYGGSTASHPTPRDTLARVIVATAEAGPCRCPRPVQGHGRGHRHHHHHHHRLLVTIQPHHVVEYGLPGVGHYRCHLVGVQVVTVTHYSTQSRPRDDVQVAVGAWEVVDQGRPHGVGTNQYEEGEIHILMARGMVETGPAWIHLQLPGMIDVDRL
jgi:hypothetical protein